MSDKAFSVPDQIIRNADGTFSVDIIRQEDGRLMETLIVTAENFPPRKKGKKVVWQLPDSGDARLGVYEKERVLTLVGAHPTHSRVPVRA